MTHFNVTFTRDNGTHVTVTMEASDSFEAREDALDYLRKEGEGFLVHVRTKRAAQLVCD